MKKRQIIASALLCLACVLSWRLTRQIDESYEDVYIYDSTEMSDSTFSNERHFRIEPGSSENEWIISYRPPCGFYSFYLIFFLLLWWPYLIWFAPKKNKLRESEFEQNARLEWVQQHALYPRYIAEDPERQYIYKEETVPQFIDWLLKTEVNETEQNT